MRPSYGSGMAWYSYRVTYSRWPRAVAPARTLAGRLPVFFPCFCSVSRALFPSFRAPPEKRGKGKSLKAADDCMNQVKATRPRPPPRCLLLPALNESSSGARWPNEHQSPAPIRGISQDHNLERGWVISTAGPVCCVPELSIARCLQRHTCMPTLSSGCSSYEYSNALQRRSQAQVPNWKSASGTVLGLINSLLGSSFYSWARFWQVIDDQRPWPAAVGPLFFLHGQRFLAALQWREGRQYWTLPRDRKDGKGSLLLPWTNPGKSGQDPRYHRYGWTIPPSPSMEILSPSEPGATATL